MNKNSIFTFLVILSSAISCNHVYKEYDKDSFPNYSWKQGQELTFSPNIKDVNKGYKLTLGIRHLYGFSLASMNVAVTTLSPSGKKTTQNYTIVIKDSDSKYVGSCAGDICDLEVVVEDNIRYEETGQYQYFVTHQVKADKIRGVMEFGLIIDEKE
jgi:gliding motility-associated lipoprotein GldH